MRYNNYVMALTERLDQAIASAREQHGLRPFEYSSHDYEAARRLVLGGSPVDRVVALFSQPVAFSTRPSDNPSANGASLEGRTNGLLWNPGSGTPQQNKIASYGDVSMHVGYGKRLDSNVDYSGNVPSDMKSSIRKRGSLQLPSVKAATGVLRAANRQNWKRAEKLFEQMIGFNAPIFYDTALYSRFLSELGSVILQRNFEYRFRWIKDERRKFIVGYEVAPPPSESNLVQMLKAINQRDIATARSIYDVLLKGGSSVFAEEHESEQQGFYREVGLLLRKNLNARVKWWLDTKGKILRYEILQPSRMRAFPDGIGTSRTNPSSRNPHRKITRKAFRFHENRTVRTEKVLQAPPLY